MIRYQGAPPHRPAYPGDVGLDLVVQESRVIPPGEFCDIDCGLCFALPVGIFGWITGRSSALRKRGLLVNTGIIDAGYRGPIYAGAFNLTSHDVLVSKGERIAQLILLPNYYAGLLWVYAEELPASARGPNGFGSSGGLNGE